jgi:DNA polymerase-3 subunit gamma/tau
MSSTIYRKYRPERWSDIAGQNHVKVTLAFEIESGKTAHAYLFSGPRGIGKTTAARILARAVNCLDRKGGEPCGKCANCVGIAEGGVLDIIEIDAASNRGIDSVRENIVEGARFAPSRLKYKVYIIDEVHMLTPEAFNALLKTLEEPPAHAIFILATTELHKVPATVASRCQRFDFRKIPFNEMVTRLHGLCDKEGITVDRRTLEEIARNSDGCLRDAESLLGKVLSVGDGRRVSYDEALTVLPRSEFASVSAFIEAMLRRDARSGIMSIDDCLEAGADIDEFAGQSIDLLRRLILVSLGGAPEAVALDMDDSQRAKLAEWKGLADTGRLVAVTELLMAKRRDIKLCHPPQLALELAVARLCETPIEVESGKFRVESTVAAVRPHQPQPVSKLQSDSLGSKLQTPNSKLSDKDVPEVSPTEEVAPAPSISLQQIQAAWPEFLRLCGEISHSLPLLLGTAEPYEVKEGNKVMVGFNYSFHRDKFNQDKVRRPMEQALAGLLKCAVLLEAALLDRKTEIVHNVSAETVSQPKGDLNPVDALAAQFGGRVVG